MKNLRKIFIVLFAAVIVFSCVACADNTQASGRVDDVISRIRALEPGDIRSQWEGLRVRDNSPAIGWRSFDDIKDEYIAKLQDVDDMDAAEKIYEDFIDDATEMLEEEHSLFLNAVVNAYDYAYNFYTNDGKVRVYSGDNSSVAFTQYDFFYNKLFNWNFYENQYALNLFEKRCRALAGPELVTEDNADIIEHYVSHSYNGGPVREEYFVPTDALGENVTYDFIRLQSLLHTENHEQRSRMLTGIAAGAKVYAEAAYIGAGDPTSTGDINYNYTEEDGIMVLAREEGHIIGCVIMRFNAADYFTMVKSVAFPKNDDGSYQNVEYERLLAAFEAYSSERHMVWGINIGNYLGLRINAAENGGRGTEYVLGKGKTTSFDDPVYVVTTENGTLSKLTAPHYLTDCEKEDEKPETITLNPGDSVVWNNDDDCYENTITVTEKKDGIVLRTVTIKIERREDGGYSMLFTENYTFSYIRVDKDYIILPE